MVTVACVDDNQQVADALRLLVERDAELSWQGWLDSADGLVEYVERVGPAVVVLDVDMPGRSPFDACAELQARCPATRALFFSGHVRRELIERALVAGAWGYVSKSDGADALLAAVREVAAGGFVLSPEARASLEQG